MMREYELTDEEYRAVTQALKYAAENAVLGASRGRLENVHRELLDQHHEDKEQ